MSSRFNPIPSNFSNDDINFKLSFDAMSLAVLLSDKLNSIGTDTELACSLICRYNSKTGLPKASLEEITNRAFGRFMRREEIRPILH